jgi:cell cycle arrest protein BUB3
MLISGSWDQSLRIFDPRAPKAEVSNHALPERVYHMNIVNNMLVVVPMALCFFVRGMSESAGISEELFQIHDEVLGVIG